MPLTPFVIRHLRLLLDHNLRSIRIADDDRDADMYFSESGCALECISLMGGMAGEW